MPCHLFGGNGSGDEVLKALAHSTYDLVLMDVRMPVMDGLTATREIRKKEKKGLRSENGTNHEGRGSTAAHLPIIAMTANAVQGDREECLQAGMDDYLRKPVDIRDLADILEKWLPLGAGGGESAPSSRHVEQAARVFSSHRTESDVSAAAQQVGSRNGSHTPTSTPSAREAVVWDRAMLLERISGDVDLEKMLLVSFLAYMPQQITTLRNAVAAGNIATSARQAHSINGATANVGAEAMQAVAIAMESAGRAGDLRGIKVRLANLALEFNRFNELAVGEL